MEESDWSMSRTTSRMISMADLVTTSLIASSIPSLTMPVTQKVSKKVKSGY
jgi:hypothetical protein